MSQRIDSLCLEGYISVLLLSYSISIGTLGSSDLLLSYSMITLALHNTIILIITLNLSVFQPYPKSLNQLIQVPEQEEQVYRSEWNSY